MGIKGPSSPLSSGAEQLEPLNSADIQDIGKSEKFEKALAQLENQQQPSQAQQAKSPTMAMMQNIASSANLGNMEGALAAVKQSARFIIGSRLKKDFRDSKDGKKMIDELGDFVADDPSLNRRILGILQKLKDTRN